MNFKNKVLKVSIQFVGVISKLIIFLGIFSSPILLKYFQYSESLSGINNSFIRFFIFLIVGISGIIIPLTGFLIYTLYDEMKERNLRLFSSEDLSRGEKHSFKLENAK